MLKWWAEISINRHVHLQCKRYNCHCQQHSTTLSLYFVSLISSARGMKMEICSCVEWIEFWLSLGYPSFGRRFFFFASKIDVSNGSDCAATMKCSLSRIQHWTLTKNKLMMHEHDDNEHWSLLDNTWDSLLQNRKKKWRSQIKKKDLKRLHWFRWSNDDGDALQNRWLDECKSVNYCVQFSPLNAIN